MSLIYCFESTDSGAPSINNAAGALISTSLPGGGQPGVGCDTAVPKDQDGGDADEEQERAA